MHLSTGLKSPSNETSFPPKPSCMPLRFSVCPCAHLQIVGAPDFKGMISSVNKPPHSGETMLEADVPHKGE